MKKRKVIIGLIVLVLVAFSMSGMECPITPAELESLIFGSYSLPTFYITDGGSNFANPYDPVTGTDITDATVTVSNDTTGVSSTASYVAASPHGSYATAANFSHNAGEQVSFSAVTTNGTITGAPTVTPDPVHSNLSPTTGATATLPVTLTWDVTQGTYEATHTWVYLYDANGSTLEAKNYQVVIPIGTTSLQITSANVDSGTYTIGVFGVNSMAISGAKAGSFVYVDGASTTAYSTNVTFQ